MSRPIALALLLCLALLPAGCRDSGAGDARIVVIGPEPRLRDPTAGPMTPGDEVLAQAVAQGLVGFDQGGNIVGALAERWNVSDDGLSYIFRLSPATWSDGRKVSADQVARTLKRAMNPAGRNPLRDTLGAVEDVVAMTDRVIEIRLAAPRPNLLSLLAQPQFAILRRGQGTGPFTLAKEREDGWLLLSRSVRGADDGDEQVERLRLRGEQAESAVTGFVNGDSDLVLGGTFADLPVARRANVPRRSLRFDPASGLFGLVPVAGGIGADVEVRRLLGEAIDRDGLIAAFAVPGLTPRATLLESGLDGGIVPVAPAWAATPLADRRAALADRARALTAEYAGRPVRLWVPSGPGGDLLLRQLAIDWGALGLKVERATSARGADFVLIDELAPSPSPAWFLRRFRCGVVSLCDADADALMDAARDTLVPAQRAALLAQAASALDEKGLFIPLSAPVRWSLVGTRISGFKTNRFARHALTGLGESTDQGSSER